MAQRPLVSILTPAYKAEPYIGQAIESVLAQTMPDWELIIVEDCSPDNTAQVVEQYLGDPRIKLIRNEQNLGECGARNRALDVARGEWITLLDADDWYEPQRLERLLRTVHDTGEQVVIDLWRTFDSGTGESQLRRMSPVYPNPRHPTRYDVYQYVYGHIAGQPLMRHELIRKHNLRYIPGILKGGDYIFQVQVIYRAGGVVVIPEALYIYRVHPNSMIQQLRNDLDRTHVLYQTLLNLPEAQRDARLRKAILIDYRRELGLQRLHEFRQAVKKARLRQALHIYRETPSVLGLYLRKLPESIRRRLKP
ncbi:MAG: glycosyltransferase family 2 protein [Armatimonadota bacterium]|nr:glycosyltransferase family 2 protein [Armatimonadota bacterium]